MFEGGFMFEFFKNIKLKYFIFFGFISLLTLGIQWPNVTVNFYFTALWEVFFVPSIIITFWDDFMRVFPSTSTEPPKIKKPIMITIIIAAYCIMFNPVMFYYFADIPNVISKKYAFSEGRVSYISLKNRIRTKQFFEIDNRVFSSYASDFIEVEKDKEYKVTMLPYSKFVINIERLEELSLKEKTEDFSYLFSFIEENYPYLKMNKRMTGINWLAKKSEYLEKIKTTKNDVEFFYVLNDILRDLQNGHVHMINREFYIEYLLPWDKLIKASPDSKKYWQNLLADTFKNPKALRAYDLLNFEFKSEDYEKNLIVQPVKNASITDIIDNKIAYIRIPRMLNNLEMEEDKKIIEEYLNKIGNYQALIIDIRGNGGGASTYWSSFLVPKITNKTLSNENYLFYRKGKVANEIMNYSKKNNKDFYENFKNIKDLDIQKLTKLPEEVSKDFEYFVKDTKTVEPRKDSINFKGNIYLLVDKQVFSSAEGLADFAKNTGFATLIGEKTGGDGIGDDPWIEMLPNSGYLFRFTKEMGTTKDGASNFEKKTEPDYLIKNSGFNPIFMDDECIKKAVELEKLKF